MPLISNEQEGQVQATVFIPTFNGERYLEDLLVSIESQDFVGNFEILIIDSGSSDKTLSIIGSHPMVRLVKIQKSDFGHGRTRNLAAKLARGKYIAYLSHDAIPIGNKWLSAIIEPLNPEGLDCVAVVGRHVARKNCFPSLKYEIDGVFNNCGPANEITVIDGSTKAVEEMTSGELFYSDVNSATRKDFLLETIAYRDVNYSEDQAFAYDLLSAGYRKAYQPNAVVEHSNDVTLFEYPKRIFDETLGLRNIGKLGDEYKDYTVVLRAIKDMAGMTKRILGDKEYGRKTKLKWIFINPLVVASKWLGIFRAATVDKNDWKAIQRFSLEAHRSHNS